VKVDSGREIRVSRQLTRLRLEAVWNEVETWHWRKSTSLEGQEFMEAV
jgi:hypothetical protein